MPSRRNGEYVPLHVRYDEDPALVEASPLAELLYIRCLALAGRSPSDGYLTDHQVVTVAGRKLGNAKKVKALLDELVALGPLAREGDGVQIRAWLKWNKSSEALGRERAADRDRKRAERASVQPDSGPRPPGQGPDRDRTGNGVGPAVESRRESANAVNRNREHRSPKNPGLGSVTADETAASAAPPAPPLTWEDGSVSGRTKTGPRARADARAADGTARNCTTAFVEGDLQADLACVDAREHTTAGSITLAYAAGVPLADHGRALRTVGQALDAGYTADLVRRGIGVLIAEQRTCTPDALRIAMHTDERPRGQNGQRRTATEKASQWLTVGLDDEAPQLRAIPGGLT